MKDWAADHPKAKLMARKRAAILDAAKDVFLRVGYEGASMEGIAAAAEVSIMTLYRHAASKDDLFAAVISSACDHSNGAKAAEYALVMEKPLEEMLNSVGMRFQEKLASRETVALFRAAMSEASRFPHLAEATYRALVGIWEENLDKLLARRSELHSIRAGARRQLCAAFIDHLVGVDTLQVFMGLKAAPLKKRERRARSATTELLSALRARRTA